MSVLAAILAAMAAWATSWRLLGLGSLPSWTHGKGRIPTRLRPQTVETWLAQAGASVTATQFVAVSLGMGIVAFALGVGLTGAVGLSVPPAFAAAASPYWYWASARRRTAEARTSAWPDALRLLVGLLGSGVATLHDALAELARSGPLSLRAPMRRYVRLSWNIGDKAALEVLRGELADPVSDCVLLSFQAALEEGSETVVAVLRDLGAQIVADLQLAEKIRTAQTQSRIANWSCFALPYLVLLLLCFTNPSYRAFFSGAFGSMLILLGLGVSTLGLVIGTRLVRPIASGERIFAKVTR